MMLRIQLLKIEKNIKMLGQVFIRLLNGETFTETVLENTEVPTPFEQFEKYVFTPGKALGLSDIKAKLLFIHVYALMLLENLKELTIYLEAICDGLQSFRDKENLPILFKDQRELFDKFIKLPYSLFELPEPNSLIPTYSRKSGKFLKRKDFSDRGNIILLYLCNCLFYYDMTGSCMLERLKSRNKEITPEFNRFYKFYEKYNFMPFEITEEMRKEWSQVVQDLPDVTEKDSNNREVVLRILYDDPKYKNVLTPGILNYIHVLAKICNAEKLLIETIEDIDMNLQNILDKISIFLAKISLKDYKIKIEVVGPIIEYEAQQDFIGTFKITFFRIYDTEVITEMKLGEKSKEADFNFIGTIKEINALRTLPFLNNRISRKFLSSFFTDAFNNFYNQQCFFSNEEKKKYLINLFDFMDKHSNLDHEATIRIIGKVVKSVDLSNQQTRSIFKPFFVAVKDLFNSDEEIRETWLSLYTEDSEAELEVVRNF